MILYGQRHSRAGRCLWALEELGVAYSQVPIDGQKGENRTQEFLALNPSGKVPVLDDNGFVLRESLAINSYLVAKAKTPLRPDDLQVKALIDQWSCWAATEIEAPLTMVIYERRRAAAAGSEPNATLAGDCIALAEKALTLLEGHLQSRDHVAGDGFTLGDLNACSVVMLTPMFLDLSAYPAVQAWVARCTQRPAWRRVESKP